MPYSSFSPSPVYRHRCFFPHITVHRVTSSILRYYTIVPDFHPVIFTVFWPVSAHFCACAQENSDTSLFSLLWPCAIIKPCWRKGILSPHTPQNPTAACLLPWHTHSAFSRIQPTYLGSGFSPLPFHNKKISHQKLVDFFVDFTKKRPFLS